MAAHESDHCSHVRVVVRVRPPNEREKLANFTSVVQVVDKHILVFDPKVEEVNFFHGRSVASRDITKRKNKDLKFVFDCVFDENSNQQEVYEQTTRIVLDGVLNGYNSTVLAYGATGAGKTHTMLGSPEEPGVMYLTMMDLYNRIESMKEEKVCNVAVSYLEVYNEQIRDLLANSGPLAVREDAQKGVVVQGLSLHQPKSAENILQLLDYGNKNRTQHPTDMNAASSRSHAVFQIYLRQQEKSASINQNVRLAKMSLIDLAGSERASATNAKGARLREGTNINRSLLALGNVINALADPKTKKQHIPYRNSKLTRLLKDSLGGNCHTIMIAAVSPSSFSYDDTYNTLKYANRAKDIKTAVKSNVLSLDSHISQYAKICEQQKKEIAMLKEKLKNYEEQSKLSNTNQQQAEIKRFQELLQYIFTNREEIRTDFCKLELQLKQTELKAIYQKQHHEQIQMLCSQEQVVKATLKRDHRLEALMAKQAITQKRKQEEMKRFEENTNWLHRVEDEMRLLGPDKQIPPELSKDLQCCHLKLEVKDLKAQIEHMNLLVSLQEREYRYSEKLLNTFLPAFRRQYEILQQAGFADCVVESDFQELKHLVQREKAVVWADQTIAEDLNKTDLPDIPSIVSFPHPSCTQTTAFHGEKMVPKIPPEESVLPNESAIPAAMPYAGQENAALMAVKENLPPKPVEVVLPRKRTRRKLMDSPQASENVGAFQVPKSNDADESMTEELTPIVYTPDCANKTITITKEIGQNLQSTSSFMAHDKDVQKLGFTFNLKPRLGLPSLLNKNLGKLGEKPSYMGMTSAAERKRKLLSLAAGSAVKEEKMQLPVPKRIKQDVPIECKALRVKRATGLSKNKDSSAQRRLPRSISEGNVAGAKRKPFSFLESSQQLLRATKKK
ncbi:kinesin-like protein KIF18A isoform X2 [Eleutherodactylus coqui]|uniref:kinesin-like protein KIF18A isoform X2 n=1 Tax=Eleutherodactylus coqui TaxID=57060 RepID=UPI0034622003